jgi:hypothetical protein
MSILQNIRYKQIRPQATSTYDSFNGEVTFNFNVGNNEVYVPSETYVNVVIELSEHIANGVVGNLAAATGLSSSPLSCLFTNGTLNINNKEVCKVSEYPQTAFIYNALSKSAQKLQNNDSTDPIFLNKRYGIAATPADDLNSQMELVKSSLGIKNVTPATNNIHVFEIAQRMPLLITNDEVTGNTNYQYKLQVDNNWRNQILQSSAAIGPAVGVTDATTAAGTLKLNVRDIYLNVSLYETDSIPQSVKSTVSYKEMFSTTRTISQNAGSERYVITLPRNAESVFFCLFDSRRATTANLSPTAFNCDALKALTSYEIRYGKSVMPSPTYQLNLSDEADTLASRVRSNARAFKEFIYNTMDLSPNGSVFDLVSWASNPIFYHRVVKPVGDTSNELDINLVFNGNHSNSILYVGAIFAKEVNIEYNESGLVSQVEVIERL